jgi:hypothetical protein
MAITAVDEDAGEGAKKKRRKLAGETDDAKEEGAAGQAVGEPVRRRRGDPGTHERHDLPKNSR